MADGQGGQQNWNLVPVWDGKPESFSHFVQEIKWTVSATRKDDRHLLGPRVIRKALQSGHPALVQLMYKLDPSDFTKEDSVMKLVKYLEESPLNRQALPDAGNKIGSYYRRLRKRPAESVPNFLIREDKVHDEMLKALQRLLREKELDFGTYEVTIEELRQFCGMNPDESMYFGPGDEGVESNSEAESTKTNSQRTPTPRQPGAAFTASGPSRTRHSSSSAASTEVPKAKGRDLVQRLMEKGLIPLSALDVIRGWMLLEMSTGTEEERRLIRAATRNKLGYQDIKAALLSMFEEKHHRIPLDGDRKGKGKYGGLFFNDGSYFGADDIEDFTGEFDDTFYANEGSTYGDGYGNWDWWSEEQPFEAWWNDESTGDEPVPDPVEPDETLAHLMKEQEDAERANAEMQIMMAENHRNLMEARRAVSQAAKDRGWGSPPQQRQQKSTSHYWSKGGKGKFPNKGKLNYYEDAALLKGKPGSGAKGNFNKGFPKGFLKGKGIGSTKGTSKDVNCMSGFHFFPIEENIPFEEIYAEGDEPLKSSESIIDTGATATAGGQEAVESLCRAVMKDFPDARMEVFSEERPWFRYGNGRWGRALYKVVLSHNEVHVPIYSLPSPGVPVLTGMRELMQFGAVLNCHNGKCLMNGRKASLRLTRKKHLIIDYLSDVFNVCGLDGTSSSASNANAPAHARPTKAGQRIQVHGQALPRTRADQPHCSDTHFAEAHDLWMFDVMPTVHMDDDECAEQQHDSFVQFSPSSTSHSVIDEYAQHLGISLREMDFLMESTATVPQVFQKVEKQVHFAPEDDRRCNESSDERMDERSSARDFERSSKFHGSVKSTKREEQIESEDHFRRDKSHGSRY